MKLSSDYDTVKRNPRSFTWGPAVGFHEVGPYRIIEYRATFEAVPVSEPLLFHVYVGDRDTNSSYNTLDAALAGAIAYRSEGPNHHADVYFIAALKALKEAN